MKEAEKERLCSIKKQIEEEENKIRRIKQKKNLEIQMGRKLALSTAELRKEIRLVIYIFRYWFYWNVFTFFRRSTEMDLFNHRWNIYVSYVI